MRDKTTHQTQCILLSPTGYKDLDRIRRGIGYRMGAKNISGHIRLALSAMANMSPEDQVRAVERYLKECGEAVAPVNA